MRTFLFLIEASFAHRQCPGAPVTIRVCSPGPSDFRHHLCPAKGNLTNAR
jgi:hypothetical protein